MSIFFDFKTINELIGDNYCRQVKQDTSKFTPDDWIRYIDPLVTYALREPTQGMTTQQSYEKFILLGVLVGLGKTPQEAINQVQEWQNTGTSQLLKSGKSTGTNVGMHIGENTGTGSNPTSTNRQVKQDTSKFTPDDWIRYIEPLVTYALRDTTQGMTTQQSYQKFILSGVLVGLGKTPQEAINQVQEWQNTGTSQLLKSSKSTGTNVGMHIGENTGIGSSTTPANKQIKQDTSKFTPDDWIRYVDPLVTYALRDTTQGMTTQQSYQKFILLGVLVGLGKTPQEAITQIQEWQNTGASQLLKSGTSTGTTPGAEASGNTITRNRLFFD